MNVIIIISLLWKSEKLKNKKQDIKKEIEKSQKIIKGLKEEKQKILNQTILNHSVIESIDFQIWKLNEKLLSLFDKLMEI